MGKVIGRKKFHLIVACSNVKTVSTKTEIGERTASTAWLGT